MAASALPSSLAAELAYIEGLARRPAETADELAALLRAIYDAVLAGDLRRYSADDIRTITPRIVPALFQLRLFLRSRIRDWQARGLMIRDVQRGLRDVFRITRYGADVLSEAHAGHPRMESGEPLRAFTGGPLELLRNPAFLAPGQDVDFRPGDVIVVRGLAHNSAAIARIGDIDSQFSHVGMVHVDEKGRRWMVEALIEDGAVVMPLEEALSHSLARAVLFRHRDPELARRAAAFIYKRVRSTQPWYGRRLLYDFTMQLNGYRRLFCSKLVRLAYLRGSNGGYELPSYPTRLDMVNRDFFERIGVTALETFAPADLEIEPDFDIVAEWQDIRVTAQARTHDLIMTKLFEWMDAYGYRFEETVAIRLISMLGRMSAFLSEDAKNLIADVVPKVPINMPRRTIATIAMLHATAEPLYQQLLRQDRTQISAGGHQLHARQVLDELDRIRERAGGRIGYLVMGQPA